MYFPLNNVPAKKPPNIIIEGLKRGVLDAIFNCNNAHLFLIFLVLHKKVSSNPCRAKKKSILIDGCL